ncbi:MAG: S8 family serine peptidase [Ardenticatenaceae bacterium]|nr:S8 family serine peptidase [Ardenticatenaceae bacterium]
MQRLRLLLIPTVSALALLAVIVVGVQLSTPARAGGPDQPTTIKTASDSATAKIDTDLIPAVEAQVTTDEAVVIISHPGTSFGNLLPRAVTRPDQDDGQQVTLAIVPANQLVKVATLPGVIRIEKAVGGGSSYAPLPSDPGYDVKRAPTLEERKQQMAALKAMDKGWSEEVKAQGQTGKGGAQPTGWFDVRDGHESSAAWKKGYTGKGVRVAVIDDGVDFAHPDLMGTWATVPETTSAVTTPSPYAGWVMAFDPYSMLLYAFDGYFGTHFVADGASWYINTSETPRVVRDFDGTTRLAYTPLAGEDGSRSFEHVYTLNDTSRSGVYHIGSHPDDNLLAVFGERVAVLLVDEHTRGVYDTVYVDLDNDYDFRDEKPVTLMDPVSYRDMNGDGYTDISGGAIYYIADGNLPLPVSDWLYGFGYPGYPPVPGNGDMVAFTGALDEGYTHGTQCASNVVGQGMINGLAPAFRDLPGDGKPNGVVQGAAPDAALVNIGNIYTVDSAATDAWLFSIYGYDGYRQSGDEVHIGSNSFGYSATDNDGWDYYSRYAERTIRRGRYTQLLFATGNGAPGFGTVTAPAPPSGLGIGASTQFGSTGWDSITDTNQILHGDIIRWSNRGPGARGDQGVSVTADGAYAAGDEGINYFGFDGWYSWATWGGTSRSTPAAAGNLALVYQAFWDRHHRWPNWDEARAIFMSGATDQNYDVFVQGAGTVNADRATDVAAGRTGGYVTPDSWQVGDFRGEEHPAFARIIMPSQTDVQSFTIANDSDFPISATLAARTFEQLPEATYRFTRTSAPVSRESSYNFNAPDYLYKLDTNRIPADADLMIVRLAVPFSQFDGNGDYNPDQLWRALVYNWTDINGDGNLWEDADGNGVVTHPNKVPYEPHNIDGSPELDWARTEIDQYEYVRFSYGHAYNNLQEVWVQEPRARMADGLFIGLQHNFRTAAIPQTDLTIEVTFYKKVDWNLLHLASTEITVPANDTASFQATASVPPDHAYGLYEGAIEVTQTSLRRQDNVVYFPLVMQAARRAAASGGGTPAGVPAGFSLVTDRAIVPVVVNVAAEMTGTMVFGGSEAGQTTSLYNNGGIRGGFDWSWRNESGDWRFFFFDVPSAPAEGTQFIVRSEWADSMPTDLDALIFGPTSDRFSDPNHPDNSGSNWADPAWYGPYTLETVAASENTYFGSGKWRFRTATGGPAEWITGPITEGLHAMVNHNVLYKGDQFSVPFTDTVSTLSVAPSEINITGSNQPNTCVDVSFSAGLDLNGFSAEGFGLSRPVMVEGTARQDDPNDPATSSYYYEFTLDHASRVTVNTGGASGNDIDLYLLYDANKDGEFDFDTEILAASTTSTDEETVTVIAPADGTYRAYVHGWNVPTGSATFDLVVDAIQGNDVTVTGMPAGAVPAGTEVNLNVCFPIPTGEGETFKGEILLGPDVAPSAVSIPIMVEGR